MKHTIEEIVKQILDAVDNEYYEHDTCGYEFGCVITSETLKKSLEKIIRQKIQSIIEEKDKEIKDIRRACRCGWDYCLTKRDMKNYEKIIVDKYKQRFKEENEKM